ncbi:hypothetical protein EAL2_808p06270 (plasmid) [Peptoclostridium acidaminophilum DSM 3953]|uniref:Uncharacterized protein n=1 Tax=Peptoclostridium acidaminophilum DSM 3953 TaxID=1286171 RepID=W8TBD6_PEPAC|nr:hypothetical protein [Peptoclostridium acidaminophilum]AHM58130.1 hypothetical protein EAL2_808p06270 [Peptoclostridium acidaminophilum DSM 3953]
MTEKNVSLEERIKELEALLKEKDEMINKLQAELKRKEVQCHRLERAGDDY